MLAIEPEVAQEKTCHTCGVTKPRSEFHKHSSCAGGLRPDCKECRKKEARAYYLGNKEAILERNRKWAQENPEAELARHANWRANNLARARETGRRHQQKRRDTIKGRLETSMSTGVKRGLRRGEKAARRAFDLLGYSVDDLRRHLEKQFTDGMSWENYGADGWEIDHIIPLSAHHYETPEDIDFKKAWALENLQPLWRSDNRKKHAKLSKSFQPSLLIATNDNRPTPRKETA